ncbi:MAG TPA: hypothetical protein PLP04_13730, partial [Bryobacteraceae bacterium]|nr:hypothetical protein [Bryobacteraceae bacterium]
PLGIQRVKVVAVSVTELERANRFYRDKLGLEPAFEGAEQVGWQLGQVILMLKADWAAPTEQPNPRITLATDHAPATQKALRARGVVEELPLPPFAQAARLMAETDYLLLIDFTTGAPGLQVPSKLYTYIRIGRPVLAITTRNSPVERILGRSGIPHACIYPDSPAEEIDCRVLDFLSLPTDPVSASDWFWENFDCTVQTRTLASILDRLVLR